jgi:hypothetical protein
MTTLGKIVGGMIIILGGYFCSSYGNTDFRFRGCASGKKREEELSEDTKDLENG